MPYWNWTRHDHDFEPVDLNSGEAALKADGLTSVGPDRHELEPSIPIPASTLVGDPTPPPPPRLTGRPATLRPFLHGGPGAAWPEAGIDEGSS